MLTKNQIQDVLGSSNARPKVLTDEDKVRVMEMCEEGNSLQEIVDELQETNDAIKKDHIKNYLKRQLKKIESAE